MVHQFGKYDARPVGYGPCGGVAQRLGGRQQHGGHGGVAQVETRMPRIVGFERRRSRVVAAAPGQHLRFAVACGCFALVEPLQGSVVLFVQPPRLFYRDPLLAEAAEHAVEGVDGPLQVGDVGFAEDESLLAEQFARAVRLLDAARRELDVGPSREAVFLVPDAFAVAKQYDAFHWSVFFPLLRKFGSELMRAADGRRDGVGVAGPGTCGLAAGTGRSGGRMIARRGDRMTGRGWLTGRRAEWSGVEWSGVE